MKNSENSWDLQPASINGWGCGSTETIITREQDWGLEDSTEEVITNGFTGV